MPAVFRTTGEENDRDLFLHGAPDLVDKDPEPSDASRVLMDQVLHRDKKLTKTARNDTDGRVDPFPPSRPT